MTKDRRRKPPFFCTSTNKTTQANSSGEVRWLTSQHTGLYPAQARQEEGGTPLTGLTSVSVGGLPTSNFLWYPPDTPSSTGAFYE